MQVQQIIQQFRRSLIPEEQSTILQACSGMPLSSPALVRSYHDLLLFLCAFPADPFIAERASAEMQRLILTVEQKKKTSRWSWALQGSGIAHTELRCQFSASLTGWLLRRYPSHVIPAEAGVSKESSAYFFQELLPAAEFQDTTQHELGFWKRVQLLCGEYKNRAALQWILDLLAQQDMPALLRDRLYDDLKIFVQIRTDAVFSRSFLHAHYQTAGKHGGRLSLNAAERTTVLDTMKASLCFYFRETDPVTYGDPAALLCYDRGNGTMIALLGMEKERQLALESYFGFMVFQNGIPVAYGGGWIFAHRCRIGVNIYPPFRGAGSARIFQQVLDLYTEVFRIRRFIVKPYQFGKGNPDGIRSGAFWFYYKLGFRPGTKDLMKLADKEWKKIRADKKYRSAVPVLKQFTAAPVVLMLGTAPGDETDPGILSSGITTMIRNEFAGDRRTAQKAALAHLDNILHGQKIPAALLNSPLCMAWALVLYAKRSRKLPGRQRSVALLELLKYKVAGDEMQYQQQLQRCSFLYC